jgi:hypothetical protein
MFIMTMKLTFLLWTPGELSGVAVAADGVDVAAGDGLVGDEAEDDDQGAEDQARDGKEVPGRPVANR